MGVNADLSLSLHHASQQKMLIALLLAFMNKCEKHFGDDLIQSENRKKLDDFSVHLKSLQERVQESHGKFESSPALPALAPHPAQRRRYGSASTSELPSLEPEVQARQLFQRLPRWEEPPPKRAGRISPRDLQRAAVEVQQEFRRCKESSISSDSDGDLDESSSESDESVHGAASRDTPEHPQLGPITEEPSAPEHDFSEVSGEEVMPSTRDATQHDDSNVNADVNPLGNTPSTRATSGSSSSEVSLPSTRPRPSRYLRREHFRTT
eukprot:TRINITY_DN8043_c0_g2_i1.p1 TRINITY_DN8043_c0_g2~~TRINITY_DN8043_c0_g2_i1.p1  ORF type:complete len:306 (+),score=38.88 TRINITY_DN8043_c0_g2_i1:121-918(+)